MAVGNQRMLSLTPLRMSGREGKSERVGRRGPQMRSSSERAVDATVGKRIIAWMTLRGVSCNDFWVLGEGGFTHSR